MATKKVQKVSRVESLTAPLIDVTGKKVGQIKLPQSLFDAKITRRLLAQSVRVYLANQRGGTASTKTRGEVEGSTRKIYRQKGTGRARHGSIRAPIFVGGGTIFGPQPRDYRLRLTTKMKRAALASALTIQWQAGKIVVVSGLAELKPKTKLMVAALTAIGATGRSLLVTNSAQNVIRAAQNLAKLTLLSAKNLNSYAVLAAVKIVLMKEAVTDLEKTFK